MKTLLTQKSFSEYMLSVLTTFTPNNEISPTRDESSPLHNVDYVNLYDQEAGTIIFLIGRHPSADYRIRINDSNVDIWRNLDANGLTGPLESIISWQRSPTGINIE